MHTNKEVIRYSLQVIVLFCSMILIYHSSCPLSFYFQRPQTCRSLGMFRACFSGSDYSILYAHILRWDVPTNETTIRIHCDLSTFHLSNPQQKESLITALSSTPFFRPFFNSNHGSYDPQRETHFL